MWRALPVRGRPPSSQSPGPCVEPGRYEHWPTDHRGPLGMLVRPTCIERREHKRRRMSRGPLVPTRGSSLPNRKPPEARASTGNWCAPRSCPHSNASREMRHRKTADNAAPIRGHRTGRITMIRTLCECTEDRPPPMMPIRSDLCGAAPVARSSTPWLHAPCPLRATA